MKSFLLVRVLVLSKRMLCILYFFKVRSLLFSVAAYKEKWFISRTINNVKLFVFLVTFKSSRYALAQKKTYLIVLYFPSHVEICDIALLHQCKNLHNENRFNSVYESVSLCKPTCKLVDFLQTLVLTHVFKTPPKCIL